MTKRKKKPPFQRTPAEEKLYRIYTEQGWVCILPVNGGQDIPIYTTKLDSFGFLSAEMAKDAATSAGLTAFSILQD